MFTLLMTLVALFHNISLFYRSYLGMSLKETRFNCKILTSKIVHQLIRDAPPTRPTKHKQ